QVQPHLSRDLLRQFQEKSREFGTLNRVYCARQTCSRFLGPLTETMFGVKVYDCSAPDCGTRTCANCRGQYDGWMHTCRQDQGAEHVLNLGRTEGWVRCPGCSQLIELNMGCYHMTCRCRTEFCYVCSARWKTCRCPQWDERRLLAAAEQRVDAQLGGAVDTTTRRHQTQALHFGTVQSAAIPTQHQSHARSHVQAVQAAQPPQASTSTSATLSNPYSRTRPAVPPKPASLTSTTTSPQPSPVVPPKPATAGTNTRTTDTGSTPTSNVGTQNDTIRQRMIREMAERLRVDHHCEHIKWKYRQGGGRCENCHNALPMYLFRCLGCEMLACNRCRRNRL
ncbi:hypothetical protein EDC04DRAFT_2570160, partial [Pisolithus marmoratus]